MVGGYVCGADGARVTAFWQEHQVGGPYASLEESTNALRERNAKFPTLLELMPVNFPGKRILDYGCGPGHDTLLFLENGAKHVYFADISWQALKTTSERLEMHGLRDLSTALFSDDKLPLVDHIHCAGVLHHVHDPVHALYRMRRAGRDANVMVYDGEQSDHSESEVPITEWWTHAQFLSLASEAGWRGKYLGSYPCSAEWRPNCNAACYRLW